MADYATWKAENPRLRGGVDRILRDTLESELGRPPSGPEVSAEAQRMIDNGTFEKFVQFVLDENGRDAAWALRR